MKQKEQQFKAKAYRFMIGRIFQLILALVFLLFIGRFLYLGISTNVAGENLTQRTNQLYRRNEVIKARRGTIYDRNGITLAEDSNSYTIYAILDKSAIDYHDKPLYVVNKKQTANELAKVLPLSSQKILTYLTPKHNAYQVEFGSGGSNLSLAQKKEIESFKLPGIKFVQAPTRLYPNGSLASHIIGIAQPETVKGTQDLIGTMGLEAYFNRQLSGKNGYREAFVDAEHYQLPNGLHKNKSAVDGDDLYLTLDFQMQNYLESLMDNVQEKYQPVGMTAVVEDMKTGKVLAASQRPTFNPQTKQGLNSSWRNTLVQDAYEPGSVFKILTLAATIQSGNYNPNAYYRSGTLKVDGSTIHDWNDVGWGSIPFSQAFPRSSNVGMSTLEQKMGAQVWKSYLNKFGIGKKTGVTLPGEVSGSLSFKSGIDQAVTSFGQGVDVTAMQMIQAFSSLANKGQMIKPQFVEKIKNADGKVIQKYHVKKAGSPVYSAQTAETILKSMKDVINKDYGTGIAYKMPGVDIGVKTGTAQIASPKGGYLTGANNYIFSVVGVYPDSSPRYSIYITMKQPQKMTAPAETILASIFKPMMNRIILLSATNNIVASQKVDVPLVVSKNVSDAETTTSADNMALVKIGNGKKVVKQSLPKGQQVASGTKLFVLTNGKLTYPDMTGWTGSDVQNFANLVNIKIKISGQGRVVKQSAKKGTFITAGSTLTVNLKE